MMLRWIATFVFALLVSMSPAYAKWREARSQHFTIYSEQSARELTKFAEDLERFDKGLRTVFSLGDRQVSRASRVTVFVLSDTDAVRRLAGPKMGRSIAGFYRAWSSGPIAFVPRNTRGDDGFEKIVLQHEYAHHFLYQNFSAVIPAWFSEGFAELASTAQLERDGALSLGNAAQHRGYAILNTKPITVASLLEWKPSIRRPGEMDRYYGYAWLLSHYLYFDPSRRGQLTAYMRRLNSGEPHVDAARAVFGDFAKLDKDLQAYVNGRLSGLRINKAALTIAPVSIRELGEGEAAMMEVRKQSKAGVNKDEAPRVAAMARSVAARFPSDPAVQTALAEAEFDAGNFNEAIAAAERAIAADPKALEALTYKGAAQLRLAEAAGTKDVRSWRRIRDTLVAANRLDPDHPEPLALFYRSFSSQGVEPSANALQGALRALELAPQDTGLRMQLAHHLLYQDKGKEARALLLRVASMPHGGALREHAADIIAALDARGAKAALQIMVDRRPPMDEADQSGLVPSAPASRD